MRVLLLIQGYKLSHGLRYRCRLVMSWPSGLHRRRAIATHRSPTTAAQTSAKGGNLHMPRNPVPKPSVEPDLPPTLC
jgi:hypothetical protein